MSHIKIITSLLLLFFSLSLNAKAVCTLLEKNVELRKYSFKCNDEIVKIQCEIKNKNVCTVNIKEKLRSMKFDLTEDQINSLNLFSSSPDEKIECKASKRLCNIDQHVCDRYKGTFETAKKNFEESLRPKGPCKSVLGSNVQNIGVFSSEFVSDANFSKESCENISSQALDSIKNRIAIFKQNVSLPLSNPQGIIYGCVGEEGVELKSREELVKLKTPSLNRLREIILGKMDSAEQLKGLACTIGNSFFYSDGKLNIDNVMCAITEESVLEVGDNGINCTPKVSDISSKFANERTAIAAGAKMAKADTTPIEQKPMPEAMASQIGKPIGLTPALAQVDQVAPGSGSVGTEYSSAVGAVRNSIPTTAALQAGQAFAPVYEKLSTIGKSVGSSSTSVRQGIIGSGSPARSNASGIVTVTRKMPTTVNSDSSNSISDVAETPVKGASATLTKNSAVADPGGLKKMAVDSRNVNKDEVAPALGGPRSLGLTGGGSSSGVSRGPSNSDISGSTDVGSLEAAATVQKKIIQLNTPAQIDSFFKQDAVKIPNLRELLYSEATSKILASKGIRIVNQSGDESGESVAKAKYLFRDDGSKFTPLKLAKKN